MKKIALSLVLAFMVGLQPMMLPMQGKVQAAEAISNSDIEAKLLNIEDRLMRTKLVIKKLKQNYLLAVKSEQRMADAGVPEADAMRIKREFQHKVKRMVNAAVIQIDNI